MSAPVDDGAIVRLAMALLIVELRPESNMQIPYKALLEAFELAGFDKTENPLVGVTDEQLLALLHRLSARVSPPRSTGETDVETALREAAKSTEMAARTADEVLRGPACNDSCG